MEKKNLLPNEPLRCNVKVIQCVFWYHLKKNVGLKHSMCFRHVL